MGVPNPLNAELAGEEVASLLSSDNLPTVAKNRELANKVILKEERNHLSTWLLHQPYQSVSRLWT